MKTDGSATKTGTRSVRDRLATLPPVQFLKRYSPRWRRRQRPTLGFDQPPRELKELAIPMRSAAPSLATRVFVRARIRFTRVAAWSAFGLGRATTRATALSQKLMLPIRAACARARSAAQPAVERISAACSRLQPAPWEVTQTSHLLARTNRVRRVLAGVVACEWTATAGLGTILLVKVLGGRPLDGGLVNTCGLTVFVLSLVGLGLHAWLQHLVTAWRSLELFMCGECGELRNFSPSMPCPRCHTEALPVFPGQLPTSWLTCQRAVGSVLAGAPAGIVGCALLVVRVVFA